MANQEKHWEEIRRDVRDEIKRRIEQRDKYSIQLIIALGAIISIAFIKSEFREVLIAAPFVSIYFTVLILYSYRIHKVLAKYFREVVGPALANLYGTPKELEWGLWYSKHEVSGIRRWFFLGTMWIIAALSLLYLWLSQPQEPFRTILIVFTVLYSLAISGVTVWDCCTSKK